MMKELDTDEVYLYDGGEADAEIWQFDANAPFGPFVAVEVTTDEHQASIELHSPDTAARWALAILARSGVEDDDFNLHMAMDMLRGAIEVEEAKHDFKIGEYVEVFDPSKDAGWLLAQVTEYNRHGGYRVRNYWENLDWYAPNHVRKVDQDD